MIVKGKSTKHKDCLRLCLSSSRKAIYTEQSALLCVKSQLSLEALNLLQLTSTAHSAPFQMDPEIWEFSDVIPVFTSLGTMQDLAGVLQAIAKKHVLH